MMIRIGHGGIKCDSFESIEASVNNIIPSKYLFYDIFGIFNKILGKKVVYSGGYYYIQIENGQEMYEFDKVDMNEFADNVIDFSQYLSNNNIELLFAYLPSKPGNDNDLISRGYSSYGGDNADEMIKLLKERNVNTLDMREIFFETGQNFYDFYYRTDHHWNNEAGFLAANVIAERLNAEGGHSVFEKNFSRKIYRSCWLGENGRIMSHVISGLDDYILIEPQFPTNIEYIVPGEMDLIGDFSVLIDKDIFDIAPSLKKYYTTSYHYSFCFSNYPQSRIINHDNPGGSRILLLKDSFALNMAPFLSLACSEVTLWDLRYNSDSIKKHLLENNVDAVVIAYSGTSLLKPGMYQFK